MDVSDKQIAEALANEIGLGAFITTSLFWDCECETDYIKPFDFYECQDCGQIYEDAPDSRVNEINGHGILIDWYSTASSGDTGIPLTGLALAGAVRSTLSVRNLWEKTDMTTKGSRWTREELVVSLELFTRFPKGVNSKNPEVIRYADAVGRTANAMSIRVNNILALDPATKADGRVGLSGGRSELLVSLWDYMVNDKDGFAIESHNALVKFGLLDDTTWVVNVHGGDEVIYVGRNRDVQSTARVGQAVFRRMMFNNYEARCCISDVTVSDMLMASHILPWARCDLHRLNPANGLLLSVWHDKAFDSGYITMTDDYRVQVAYDLKIRADEFTRHTYSGL